MGINNKSSPVTDTRLALQSNRHSKKLMHTMEEEQQEYCHNADTDETL